MAPKRIWIGIAAVAATIGTTAFVRGQGQTIKATMPGGIPVFNPVEGRMVVVASKPDGALVQKGGIICELDSVELRDRLANQDIMVRAAQAELQSRRIAREVAVMAEREYKNSDFPRQIGAIEGEITMAAANLTRAEDQVDWSRRMFAKGYATLAEKNTDELTLKHARLAVERTQAHKNDLVDHLRTKAMKVLLGAIESARARELGAEAAMDRELSLQKKLTDQIDRCKVAAPVSGRIEYTAPIAVGAVVRDGEVLFRVLPDLGPKP